MPLVLKVIWWAKRNQLYKVAQYLHWRKSMWISIKCPPLPYCIVGGTSYFRTGDIHENRCLENVFDLLLVTKGELYMRVGKYDVTVKERQYLMLPPGIRHGGYRYCIEPTEFYWLHFCSEGRFSISSDDRPDVRVQASKSKFYRRDPFLITTSVYGNLDLHAYVTARQYMQILSQVKVSRATHRKTYSTGIVPIEQQSTFFELLDLLSRNRQHSATSNNLASHISEYLRHNISRPVSMNELSTEFSYSANYISRVVKQQYGMPPVRLSLEIRLDQAKRILEESQCSIKEVAKKTGFQSNTYFSRQFKKYTGMTPKEYQLAAWGSVYL